MSTDKKLDILNAKVDYLINVFPLYTIMPIGDQNDFNKASDKIQKLTEDLHKEIKSIMERE